MERDNSGLDPFGLPDWPDEADELYHPDLDLEMSDEDEGDEEREINDEVIEESLAGSPSRRMLLRGGVAAGVFGLAGASQLWTPESAEAHGTIRSYSGIGSQRTRYEASGNYSSFGYRPSFHDRMGSWINFWNDNTPWRKPIVVWTYGVHTDHRVSTAHNNGRGFDLTRIYPTLSSGSRGRRFYGRRDRWKNWSTDARKRTRRRYWGTAASAHHHFKHVLTYLYNSAHDNHIHMDNLVSGTSNSSFSTGSSAQVEHVQACCR